MVKELLPQLFNSACLDYVKWTIQFLTFCLAGRRMASQNPGASHRPLDRGQVLRAALQSLVQQGELREEDEPNNPSTKGRALNPERNLVGIIFNDLNPSFSFREDICSNSFTALTMAASIFVLVAFEYWALVGSDHLTPASLCILEPDWRGADTKSPIRM